MKLLEREKYLSELTDLLEMSLIGNGKIAAVCGEAGIGKTDLLKLLQSPIITK